VTPDTLGRVVYVRRRKRDAPRCPQCQRRYLAGSTQSRVSTETPYSVTYYYPACRCLVRPTKVPREVARVDRAA